MGSGSIGNNGGTGELFITDGVLTLQNNRVSKIQNYINSGYITTENARTLEVEYNTSYSGRTSSISVPRIQLRILSILEMVQMTFGSLLIIGK